VSDTPQRDLSDRTDAIIPGLFKSNRMSRVITVKERSEVLSWQPEANLSASQPVTVSYRHPPLSVLNPLRDAFHIFDASSPFSSADIHNQI